MLDVMIIGGGPAGLSAALILGRACREVMVLDTKQPRNAASPRMHGYPSRDGMPPLDFLECCREELRAYPNVVWRHAEATDCRAVDDEFETQIANAAPVRSRLMLLATGMADRIPEIPGLRECYGHTAHHCPYCDGWEHRGKRLVAYGQTAEAIEYAVELKGWSSDVTLCTNGITFDDWERERLRRRKIQFVADRITGITSEARRIQSVQISLGPANGATGFDWNDVFEIQRMKPLRKLLNRKSMTRQTTPNTSLSGFSSEEPIPRPATSVANGIVRAVCFAHAFEPAAPTARPSRFRRHHGIPSGTALREAS